MRLDKESPVPLHHQLRTLIQKRIADGDWKPGDRLPTEAELCKIYGISRTPVRQALKELEREGWVERFRRRGSFIRNRHDALTLSVLLSETRWVPRLRAAAHALNERTEPPLELDVRTVDYQALHDELIGAVARGEGPDIALYDAVWLAELADLDYLYPLGDIDPDWVARCRSDLYPNFVDSNSYRERLYGLQGEADLSLIWYRRDWFEAEGLPPPESWDDLIALARHFRTDEVRAKYGVSTHPFAFAGGPTAGEETVYQLSSFVYALGGELLQEGQVRLGETTRQALQFWVDLIHAEGVVSPEVTAWPRGEVAKRFAHGRLAMAVGGSYEHLHIQRMADWSDAEFARRVDVAPIPAGRSGRSGTTSGGMTFSVLRQSRHPKRAVALLQEVLRPESLAEFFEAHPGHCPTRSSVVRGVGARYGTFLQGMAALLPGARARPVLPEYDQVSYQIQRMVGQALDRKQPVAQTVEKTAEILEALVTVPA